MKNLCYGLEDKCSRIKRVWRFDTNVLAVIDSFDCSFRASLSPHEEMGLPCFLVAANTATRLPTLQR